MYGNAATGRNAEEYAYYIGTRAFTVGSDLDSIGELIQSGLLAASARACTKPAIVYSRA